MKKFMIFSAAALAGLILAAVLCLGVTPSTRQFKDAEGNILPGSIAALEEVELGNLKQWISIRGRDVSNPVLLWLHGGPGAAQMSLSHHIDEDLEEEFVVVHWDQRGAGKSNHRGFKEETMTFEQFKSDALDLVEYLKERQQTEKIYLLGHSWGTHLGTELAAEYPEHFHAYIGVSQLVESRRQLEIAYEWLEEEIEKRKDKDSLNRLGEIGVPPYKHSDYKEFAQLVSSYGGNFDKEMWRLAFISFRADEYTFMDYYRLLDGMNRGGASLHPEGEMLGVNFPEHIPALEVPVFFLVGNNDYNTPLRLVEEYYEKLEAPQKELIIFNNSAHTPFLGETEKFNREIIEIKKQTQEGKVRRSSGKHLCR